MTWVEIADCIAKYAPIATPIVAIGATGIAVYSIRAQRSIARKRAALDVFFKTELDKAIIDAYDRSYQAIGALNAATSMEEFCKTAEYHDIKSCLNIHELVAVGIHNGVLDEDVCFEFWADELMDVVRNCKRVIDFDRTQPGGSPFTYVDLERLNKTWIKRHQEMLGAQNR